MGFRAQCADGHRRSIKAFEQLTCRFNIVDADGFAVWRDSQQVAQGRSRTLIHQFGVLLIVAVLTTLYCLLQGTHHVRVIGVVFATMNVFELTALIQRLTCQPGAFRQIQQILLEVGEACAADTADHTLEAQI